MRTAIHYRMIAERTAREERTLQLIGANCNRAGMIQRNTGWHERSVQRYIETLIDQGLVETTQRHAIGGRKLMLTPEGRSRLQA